SVKERYWRQYGHPWPILKDRQISILSLRLLVRILHIPKLSFENQYKHTFLLYSAHVHVNFLTLQHIFDPTNENLRLLDAHHKTLDFVKLYNKHLKLNV